MYLRNRLRFFLFVVCFLEISVCTTERRCYRQPFPYEIHNKTFTGATLVREGPWPFHKCRRLCRQYLECFSFGIEWLDAKFGMCNIYNGLLRTDGLVAKDQMTIYMTCPIGFQWHDNIKKCYSAQPNEDVSGTNIVKRCKDRHPNATPVEPRNQVQMDTIATIAGDRDVWLGIHRPSTSNILEDFVYYSDGANVTYHYWAPGDPNNFESSEDCVASPSKKNHKWADYPCETNVSLMCEI